MAPGRPLRPEWDPLVVSEFENGSRAEELFVVFVSQVGVACSILRAVRPICSKPDCLVCTSSVRVHHLSFLRCDSFAPLQGDNDDREIECM